MAGFGKKQQNNNRGNFFTKNIQKFGENFMECINADEMQKGAIFLFRDLARGNIDIEKYGGFFLDNQFLENCLIAASSKLKLHSINHAGVNLLMSTLQPIPNDVLAVNNYNSKNAIAYDIIVTGFTNVKNSRDLNYLITMVNNLQPYKYNI